MNQKIAIFGAASAIAMEAAKVWAERRCDLVLVGRSKEKLEFIKGDLLTRGATSVHIEVSDLNEVGEHDNLLTKIHSYLPDIDVVLVAYGSLGDQKKAQLSYKDALKDLNTNFLSVVSLLTLLTNYFEKRGKGCIAVITSVAGDRGRKANYIYGTAKGALSVFLQGLRNRFGKTEISIVDIKPGLTDTPMTSHLQKGPLFASAATVGKGVVFAIDSKKEVAYLPWYWRFIMLIICLIPEKIFKKTSI